MHVILCFVYAFFMSIILVVRKNTLVILLNIRLSSLPVYNLYSHNPIFDYFLFLTLKLLWILYYEIEGF